MMEKSRCYTIAGYIDISWRLQFVHSDECMTSSRGWDYSLVDLD
jgi:hypothetical protein